MRSVRIFGFLVSFLLLGGFFYGAYIMSENDMDLGQVLNAPKYKEFQFTFDPMKERYKIIQKMIPAPVELKRDQYVLELGMCDMTWVITTDLYGEGKIIEIDYDQGKGHCELSEEEQYFVQFVYLVRIKRNVDLKKVKSITLHGDSHLAGYKSWSAKEFIEKALVINLEEQYPGVFTIMESNSSPES